MATVDGIIVDINNRTSFPGSVTFENGKITEIKKAELNQLMAMRFSQKLPYIMPGFIDSHIHIDLTQISPVEYAQLAFSQGVIGAAVDCHDITAVLGKQGILSLIENAKQSPFYFGFGAPGNICKGLYEYSDIEEILQRPEVTHLGEIKDFPSVILHEVESEKIFEIAEKYGKPADGHAPGVTRSNLTEYCKSPVSTDHEAKSYEDGLEKIMAGLKVQVQTRDAVNFVAMKDLFNKFPDKTMLCSEIVFAPNILTKGYLNKAISELTKCECDLFNVLQAACINPVNHYKLGTGLLREGDSADFIVVDSVTDFNVLKTFVKGECVYDKNEPVKEKNYNLLEPVSNVQAEKVSEQDLIISCDKDQIELNVIDAVDDELNTIRTTFPVKVSDGIIKSDTERDILKVAFLSRTEKKKIGLGFVHGFGIKKGAFAMSVSHDEHNFSCVGVSDSDMSVALNRLIEIKGGLVYVLDGEVIAEVPFGFGNLISTKKAEVLLEEFAATHSALRHKMGCTIKHPIRTMSYLFDTTVPTLKLSLHGLFSVPEQQVISLFS